MRRFSNTTGGCGRPNDGRLMPPRSPRCPIRPPALHTSDSGAAVPPAIGRCCGSSRHTARACGSSNLARATAGCRGGWLGTATMWRPWISATTRCMAWVPRWRLPHVSGSLRLVRASQERIPFADCQFDVVIAAASLHYARDLGGTVAETRRVLRLGGLLLLLDTPLYCDASVGDSRVASQVRIFMSSMPASSGTTGPGYIEVAALRDAFRAAGLAYREVPVHGAIRAAAGRIRRGLHSMARLPERATMPLVLGVRGC